MRKPAILLLTVALPLAAQWIDHRDPQTPRKNSKPDLTAPAPRAHGKPDISGVWQAERTPLSELASVLGSEMVNLQIDINDVGKYYIDAFWGLKPDQEPLRPEGAAIRKRRANAPDPPPAVCLPESPAACLSTYSK